MDILLVLGAIQAERYEPALRAMQARKRLDPKVVVASESLKHAFIPGRDSAYLGGHMIRKGLWTLEDYAERYHRPLGEFEAEMAEGLGITDGSNWQEWMWNHVIAVIYEDVKSEHLLDWGLLRHTAINLSIPDLWTASDNRLLGDHGASESGINRDIGHGVKVRNLRRAQGFPAL